MLIYLIPIMIILGVFGGVINYFKKNLSQKDNKELYKSLFIGIAASLLVPLFLRMISSDLLEDPNTLDYLVFAGLCLIASIFSTNFIDSIGKKLMDKVENIGMKVITIEKDVDDITNEDEVQEDPELLEKYVLNDEEILVLSELDGGKYTYRSISGLVNDTRLDRKFVKDTLEKLKDFNLVIEAGRTKGIRWKTSEVGKQYLASHYLDESSSS